MVRRKTTISSNPNKNQNPPDHNGANNQSKGSPPPNPPSSATPKKTPMKDTPYDDTDRVAAAQIAIASLVSEEFDGLMTVAINLVECHKECTKPGEPREAEADEFLREFKSARAENHVRTEACIRVIVEDSMRMKKAAEK